MFGVEDEAETAGRVAGLQATLEPAAVAAEAGAAASCELRVHNGSDLPTELTCEILGDAAAWAWTAPRQLTLEPGNHGVVRVVLRPPRASHVIPGPSPFTVRLLPAGGHTGGTQVDGVVEVVGFASLTARLVPPSAEGRRGSSHELFLDNEGNAPARVSIEVRPGAGGPDVAVDPATVHLGPRTSEQATVTVKVAAPSSLGAPDSTPSSSR